MLNIKEFDKLTVADQVQFINKELEKDKNISVTKLLKKYGLNKSTVIGRFTDNKYKYDINTRKYISATDVIQNNIKNKDIEQVAVTTDNNIDKDIKELLKYKDDILNMLKEYKSSSSKVADNGLIIDTDIISDKVCNHNFKVYENVKKEIQEIQEQYAHFRLVDLVSTALHEYYLKYKK